MANNNYQIKNVGKSEKALDYVLVVFCLLLSGCGAGNDEYLLTGHKALVNGPLDAPAHALLGRTPITRVPL